LLGQPQDLLGLGLNFVVVQTVLVVVGHLQVVGQPLGLVVDLADLVEMDCLVGRRSFDLDLVLEDLLPGPSVLVVLRPDPLGLVGQVQD
jgi:hypothetical protein